MTFKVIDGIDNSLQRIINVADPTSPSDAATKQYVDNLTAGFAPKDSVVACPTTNITIANPGASTFDGVTLTAGMRMVLMNQTAGTENGLWQFNGSSVALTRTTDGDTGAKLEGAFFTIDQGATYGDQMWYITTDAMVLGTTSIAFAKFAPGSTYTGANGVTVAGTTINGVVAPSGGLTVSSTGFAIDTAVVVRKFSANIGTGAATTIAVTHNLGTKDVHVQLRDNSIDQLVYLGGIVATDANTVTLVFPTAPTSNQYRVTVGA